MTRTLQVLIAVGIVLVLTFLVAGSTGASDEPQIVRVILKDYQVELSQFTVTPGKSVQFVVANQGALAHQFIVEPYVSPVSVGAENVQLIAPGTTWTIQRKLSPGVYRVTCANADHAKQGMVNAMAAQAVPQKTTPIQIDFVVSILAIVLGSVYIIGDTLGMRLTR